MAIVTVLGLCNNARSCAQVFYAKLSDRKIELQKQAQPGIQDPDQKDAWQKEWEILSRELDSVSAKLAEGNGPNDSTVSAAGDMRGLAAASKASFSLLVFGGRVGTLDATGYVERYVLWLCCGCAVTVLWLCCGCAVTVTVTDCNCECECAGTVL